MKTKSTLKEKNANDFLTHTKHEKAITLIALVIAIIVLLILAGVSIATLTGNNGILGKASTAKKETELAAEQERLELLKIEVAMDNDGVVTIEKYIEKLIQKEIVDKKEIQDGEEEGSKDVITDNGYSVNIVPNGEKDIIITVEGVAGKLTPIIKNVDVIIGTDSIEVNFEIRRGEGATSKCYYKTSDGTEKLAIKKTETSFKIEGLEPGNYPIRVEVTNANGTVTKELEGTIKQPTIENLTANTKINYIDKNGNTIPCAVLWDADSEYASEGIQIIAMKTVEPVLLGYASTGERNEGKDC